MCNGRCVIGSAALNGHTLRFLCPQSEPSSFASLKPGAAELLGCSSTSWLSTASTVAFDQRTTSGKARKMELSTADTTICPPGVLLDLLSKKEGKAGERREKQRFRSIAGSAAGSRRTGGLGGLTGGSGSSGGGGGGHRIKKRPRKLQSNFKVPLPERGNKLVGTSTNLFVCLSDWTRTKQFPQQTLKFVPVPTSLFERLDTALRAAVTGKSHRR